MAHSYRRIAVSAVALAAAATAVALAGPKISTGSVAVAGSGAVGVKGDVVILGSVTGSRAQIEIQTTRSTASIGVGGRSRRIPPHRDVVLFANRGVPFGITTTAGTVRIKVRGRGISATIFGSGTITLTGHGTYSYGYNGPTTRPWSKAVIQLHQPTDRAAARMVRTNAVAHRAPAE